MQSQSAAEPRAVEQDAAGPREVHLPHGVVATHHRGPAVEALERVRQRLNAASPGNWAVMDANDPGEGQNFIEVYSLTDGLEVVCRMPDPANYSDREGLLADADFIANAPSDLEQLLDALDAGLALADKAAALCLPGEQPESGNPGDALTAEWGRKFRAAVEEQLGGVA